MDEVQSGAQGTLFDLPGGPLKIAAGVEQLNTHIDQYGVKNGTAAPNGVAAQYFDYSFGRNDMAEFVEAAVPVISDDMGIPLIKKLEFNLSLRHDDYSDFGETTNPKVAFNWDVIDGLRLRGNWSTSFVAPPLKLCTDNAAMIAWAGIERIRAGLADEEDGFAFVPRSRWPLDGLSAPIVGSGRRGAKA